MDEVTLLRPDGRTSPFIATVDTAISAVDAELGDLFG